MLYLVIAIILLLVLVGNKVVEGYVGCRGLDERECVYHRGCLWHIDRSNSDYQGRCVPRRSLPEFLKWQQLVMRYYNPSYYYRPSYYYTSSDYSPWRRYQAVTHRLA